MKYTNDDLPIDLLVNMLGPLPKDSFVSHGCSRSPDRIGACDLRAACHIHDFHYECGGGKEHRFEADRVFYVNLRRSDLGKLLSTFYWMVVRLWGHHFFNWTSEPKPRFIAAFFETFWTRFIKW